MRLTIAQRISVDIQLSGLLARMLATQFYIKATKLSRANRSIQDASSRPGKAAAFLWSMFQYDLDMFRSCRRCLHTLSVRQIRCVSVYGANDTAEALSILAVGTSVVISAIYDDCYTGRFAAHAVLPISDCAIDRTDVIVAALVGVEEKVERLLAAGVASHRIITLQRASARGTAVRYDADLIASADESPSNSCQSAV